MGASLLVGAALSGCGRERPEVVRPKAAMTGSSVTASPKPSSARPAAFAERADEREALARALSEEGISDPRVLQAIRTVPRHAFVRPWLRPMAYADRPLPIIGGQTISQPYVVAFMTESVKATARSTCLEIGTGSGYQAAVLAELCLRTYSIEYLPDVARVGEDNLRQLGYGPERVTLRVGDGYEGWPEAAPFDAIVVTAAPSHVPEPLLDQLAIGGRLVIPVGPADAVQELQRWTRLRAGKDASSFRKESLLSVRFVPFTGTKATR